MSTLAAVAIGLLALAGCGSSNKTPSTPSTSTSAPTASTPVTTGKSATAPSSSGSTTLKLEANPEGQLKYNTSTLTANAGKVTIDMANMSPLMHNVNVESSSGKVLGATPSFQGTSKTLSLNLTPGTYKFFCSVPGHRQAGMEGTLTVK